MGKKIHDFQKWFHDEYFKEENKSRNKKKKYVTFVLGRHYYTRQ